ncbi:MAG TPA: hypothetical protein VIV60_13455 [Polyangiaceae bacterium]
MIATEASLRFAHRAGRDFDEELRVRAGDDELLRRASQIGFSASRKSGKLRRFRVGAGIAVAALVASASAGAARWLARAQSHEQLGDAAASETSRTRGNAAQAHLERIVPVAAVSATQAPEQKPGALDEGPGPKTATRAIPTDNGFGRMSESSADAIRHAKAPLGVGNASEVTPPERDTAPLPTPAAEPLTQSRATAAELFHEAGEARRRGDLQQAHTHYLELQTRFPTSNEARISYVSLGKLLLLSQRAREAQMQFQSYLARSGGALEAEALVGLADSYAQMGQRDVERRAWQELLRRHGAGVYAARATERLRLLGAATPRE